MSTPMITLKNISVTADEGRVTLVREVNLNVQPGEILGLVGPSGAGKTTLLKVLALLTESHRVKGSYIYEGRRVLPVKDKNSLVATRRNLVFIHQEPLLFKGSVRYNIEYGIRVRRQEKNSEELEDLVKAFKMDELLDRDAHSLSSGEKQRVCLLRAMAVRPNVLILDEPTQNLDPGNVRNIEANVLRYQEVQGGTVIIVTHNFFQAQRLADRTAVMVDGQVVEVGETNQLFENPQNPRVVDFLSGRMVF